jgi:predicted phosphoribosyltransferase
MKAIAHPFALGPFQTKLRAPLFEDRADAGARLGSHLAKYRGQSVLVLGIPCGGVPVAAAVARALEGELDVVVAQKLSAPISEELAIGAVTADGGRYLNEDIVRVLDVDAAYIDLVTAAEMEVVVVREARFRAGRARPPVAGRIVILVDDGLATGASMIAAARSVRALKPARLVIAVPVGSRAACRALRKEADGVICLWMPEPFWAIGPFYRDFRDTTDEEVHCLLRDARTAREAPEPVPAIS